MFKAAWETPEYERHHGFADQQHQRAADWATYAANQRANLQAQMAAQGAGANLVLDDMLQGLNSVTAADSGGVVKLSSQELADLYNAREADRAAFRGNRYQKVVIPDFKSDIQMDDYEDAPLIWLFDHWRDALTLLGFLAYGLGTWAFCELVR